MRVLYQELHQLDKLTLQALLMRMQGFSVTEISVELSLNKGSHLQAFEQV